MRCTSCQRNIAAGAEAQKMVVEYQQPDGSVKIHGYQMPDGPLTNATGMLKAGWHSKCWYIARKREAKGDAVSGRILAGAPTGYDVDKLVLNREDLDALGLTLEQARERSTVFLSVRVAKLRAVAASMGKSVGDAQVQEAFTAAEYGGPYEHEHHHRLDMYQLIAHLEHAHGMAAVVAGTLWEMGLEQKHQALHAQARVRVDRKRDSDPPEPITRDWRTQFTAEIN